jgi:hypothetical protein
MKKCSLDIVEDEIYAKRKTVRYDIRDLTVEAISHKYSDSLDEECKDMKNKYNYIYIPEYQRDFTWDEDRQSKLIESIILGLPIPFIFVAENRNSSWEIVDGSQRVRTIHSFLNNHLVLCNLSSIKSLNGYKFSELDETRQGKILNTALRIIVLSEETTEDVKTDMFERINRGSDLLKPMEKRKGIYPGKFTQFLYDYCEKSDLFKELAQIDKWLIRRQEYEELLLRFFALTDTSAYKKGINTGIAIFLDIYLEKKNAEWQVINTESLQKEIEKYTNRIDRVSEYVKNNFPYGYRHKINPQTKRSVFEAISVGVWIAMEEGKLKKSLDKEEVKKILESDEFRKNTHVANQLHMKAKLYGRVNTIYEMVLDKG